MNWLFNLFRNKAREDRRKSMKLIYEYCGNPSNFNNRKHNLGMMAINAFAYGFNSDCDELIELFNETGSQKNKALDIKPQQ